MFGKCNKAFNCIYFIQVTVCEDINNQRYLKSIHDYA